MMPSAISAAVVIAAFAAGCSTNAKMVKEARESGYRADFAIVYSETLAAVRELYPQVAENANSGVIRTAWHPVRIQSETAGESQDNPVNNSQSSALTTATNRRKAFYVRFRVFVVGGRPWEIRVEGEASSWEIGEIPTPLSGAAIPPWLKGRTDNLRVAIHKRLLDYAVPLAKDKPKKEKRERAKADPGAFSSLPPAAAKVVAEVAVAAKSRDLTALRAQMADDVAWSPGATGADTALAMYSADSSLLGAMSAVLEKGCAAAGAEVLCPADASTAGYRGYVARFAVVGGVWKLVAFFEIE